MRCLHCGNEVSLLQKLTNAQFCSAEHRQRFSDDQQKLILQRLQSSAGRLERFRRAAPSRSTPVATTTAAEAIPPARMAPFSEHAQPRPRQRSLELLTIPNLDLTSIQIVTPVLPKLATPSGDHKLGQIIADPLRPRYNPGLLSFERFDAADTLFNLESTRSG